jgi:hypothetical protein
MKTGKGVQASEILNAVVLVLLKRENYYVRR